MDVESTVREKQAWLLDEVKQAKGVDLRMHDSRTSWLEGVFARGDRKLGRVLERAYRAGCRFDSWEDQLKIDAWVEAFRVECIDPASYLGTIPVSARLPWDHVDVGLEEGFLLREYRKALKSRLSPPCGKAAGMFVHHTNLEEAKSDERKLVCYDCGVACDLSAMRKERLVYLDRLGARTKRVPEPKPAKRAPPPPGEPQKKKGPPPRLVQGEPRRYRFVIAKLGPMAFLSHLDLIRALPRSFRRIDVPIFYSSGYHPKPEMTFSPALSLGVASLAEVLDVKLTCDADAEELARALTAASPDGLVWRGGTRLGPADLGVSKAIDAARYAVGIPERALDAIGGRARLDAEIARVEASSEVKVIRRFERGLAKSVDVKRFLRGLSAGDARADAYLREARVAGDLVSLFVDVDVTGEGGVKVSEVMEALFGLENAPPWHAVRAELGLRDGARRAGEGWERIVSPLDLARVRALRAPAAEAPAVVG
jgi:radical SAM-linked protein